MLSFTRNVWNHLLRLLSIMSFSMFSCRHFSKVVRQVQGILYGPTKAQKSNIPEDSKSTSGRILWIFGIRTFVPRSWMCKKQTTVFTHFYWIWGYFFRCRFAHRWYTRSRSLGFGCWRIAFFQKKQASTVKVVRQRSPEGNTPTPRRRNTSTEMILNYSMWITSPQTQNLLIAALRFKFF